MQTVVRTPVRAEVPILKARAAAPAPSFVEYGTRHALIVAGVMLAALLQTVDATIVNVVLPVIQGNLGATIADLRVLAKRGVAGASLIAAGIAASIYGVLLLLPQFTVEQLGFTSTLSGFLMGLRAIPVALLTISSGRLANRNTVDLRLLIGGGLLVAALGSVWLSRETMTGTTLGALGPPLVLTGIGIAFIRRTRRRPRLS